MGRPSLWLSSSLILVLSACGEGGTRVSGLDSAVDTGSGGAGDASTGTGGSTGGGGMTGGGGATGSGGTAGASTGSGGVSSSGGTPGAGGVAGTGGGAGGTTASGLDLTSALRFKKVNLQISGTNSCVTASGSAVSLAACGGNGQAFRFQILGPGYVAVQDDATGNCLTVSGTSLTVAACTNQAVQQYSFTGSKTTGFQFKSLTSGGGSITSTLAVGSPAASILLLAAGDADPLAVVIDERPVGWATMPATITDSDGAEPNGDEKTRQTVPTTGGGTWEAARAKGFSNVTWFKPADFSGSAKETSITALQTALKATGPSIILFEAGTYDFSLSTPKKVNKCNATCSTSSSTYTQTGGFCPNDATCATTSGCVVGGFSDYYRTLDVGSNKTIIGLGAGATFRRLGMRWLKVSNSIYRNVSNVELPGSVRAWDDGLLFWPADHIWVDHVTFSGFGRGAVVLSGTRVSANNANGFYTYRDSGWMTFSWTVVDSRETWRCSGKEDSPYPFFTTEDPSLTFHHMLFQSGHGRNPAIDGQGAHLFNSSWVAVTDGLDGRNGAKLLVEGSYFDGSRPIRMDDPVPPVVLAPWDYTTPNGTSRRLNIFSSTAWPSLQSDWGGRNLNISTLNTNNVPVPSYPYSLDLDPSKTQATVAAGAGMGKGGFPACTLSNATTKAYACQ